MPDILLNDEIANQLRELFDAQLVHPVEIILFTKNDSCYSCDDTHQLLKELTAISDKLHLSAYDLDDNMPLAQQYKIEVAPGLVITGYDGDKLLEYGLNFAGIPSGYEFSSLIQAILLMSKRDSGLKTEIRNELKVLTRPVNLKVFVTPTWPYCPQAVVLAHQMSMENPLIHAEMIEANEFFDLAQRYNVSGVPQTTINDGAGVVLGAVPAEYLLQEIKRSVQA